MAKIFKFDPGEPDNFDNLDLIFTTIRAIADAGNLIRLFVNMEHVDEDGDISVGFWCAGGDD